MESGQNDRSEEKTNELFSRFCQAVFMVLQTFQYSNGNFILISKKFVADKVRFPRNPGS